VAARTALHRGDVEAGREGAAHVARLRVGLTAAVPFFAVQTRLELVQAYLELADAAGARLILREVRDLLHVRPDLGNLAARADRLRDQLEAMGPGTVGATSLTTAELRLLPLLPTHLTFREIGERLHVSRHTIKTQAMSVYRKLGVSSRGEAIDRVQEVGLLAR
jgi:LuxR family maltose regulon positive regulatory protein